MDPLQVFLSVCAGIGLSAACGFRVFVPLLCLSIGANTGHIHLAQSCAWIGTPLARVTFSVATVVEILAYYLPHLDNLLDTIAGPTALAAGILVTASVLTDMPPYWRWTLAVIAGGGAAASTQLATTKLRLASSATTVGLGNPVLSTIELFLASLVSVLAVIWPAVALVVALGLIAGCWALIYFVGKKVIHLFRRKTA